MLERFSIPLAEWQGQSEPTISLSSHLFVPSKFTNATPPENAALCMPDCVKFVWVLLNNRSFRIRTMPMKLKTAVAKTTFRNQSVQDIQDQGIVF